MFVIFARDQIKFSLSIGFKGNLIKDYKIRGRINLN